LKVRLTNCYWNYLLKVNLLITKGFYIFPSLKIDWGRNKMRYFTRIGEHTKELSLLLFLFCFVNLISTANDIVENEQVHELTFYLIPSPEPIEWESPAKLYTSFKKGYVKNYLVKEKYLLGHLFIKVSTPLVDEPFLIGIASASNKQKRRLLLKEKIGFSILNVELKGRIESSDELKEKIKIYTEREEIAQIKFRVNARGMKRVLEFIDTFSTKFNEHYAPSDFYGGSFYPRYHYEGSGCTALGMALIDLCAIPLKHFDPWFVQVKIPMDIIGGEFNSGKKISVRKMKRSHHWYSGEGKENIDFVTYSVYDPSIIYQWILNRLKSPVPERDSMYIPCFDTDIPGLFADFSSLNVPDDEPIFFHRENPSIFIEHFLDKLGVFRQSALKDSAM